MKKSILIVHNRYLQRGGEDNVVEQEINTLSKQGYVVRSLFLHNQQVKPSVSSVVTTPLRLFFNLSSFLAVYRRVRKYKIDIVHVHNFYYNASPSVFWAAKMAGAKTVYTLHNYRLFCLNGLFFYNGTTCTNCLNKMSFRDGIQRKCFKGSALYSRALAASQMFHRNMRTWNRKVDRFLTINRLMYDSLLLLGIPEEKIRLKANYIPDLSNHPVSPIQDRKDFYLFAGRMSEEKGIQHLIKAFKQTKRPLRLVGSGPLRDWILTQTDDNISYYPAVERSELMSWFSQCKAFVFPSIWQEGQPMTIIEAQSTGAIIIAGRSATTEQMIQEGETGHFYEAGNAESLNAVLTSFERSTEQQLLHMSMAAHDHFQQNYTEVKHLEAIEEIYNTL